MIAKTEAAGGPGLLPEVLAFTSSLPLDVQLLGEDIVGSLAHVGMLGEQGILKAEDARALQLGLLGLWRDAEAGKWKPEGEEDVHMAVEAELGRRLGALAGLVHTARSRNDQVALDLRLFLRGQGAQLLITLAALLDQLVALAGAHPELVLPSYTHRQRAQPILLGYWLSAYGQMFARDVQAFEHALEAADLLPLGVGAIAGTSLPIDREKTRRLLQFGGITANGLDTVGDRDFALDFLYAASRTGLHMSRLATDLVDFSSSEFGFVKLEGAIACGSSMMPQKRNPDVFELVRGKSGAPVGSLLSLFITLKGLPGGYNRDLQEDRRHVLETGPALRSTLEALALGLRHVHFDAERCREALRRDYTQATDLAEALVRGGMPFREAYQAVGALVAKAQAEKLPLAEVKLAFAQAVSPAFTAEVLAGAELATSVARKVNAGGTGPAAVAAQLEALRGAARAARARAARVPTLATLFGAFEGRLQ